MTRTNFAWIALVVATPFASGCRSSDSSTTTDGHAATDSKSADGAGSNADACTSYASSTVAAMRMGTHTGCFELNTVTIGTTPSTKNPDLFIQDPAGGDFSAIMTKCESTSTTHPCSVAATVAALPDGHSVTVKGTYIKTASTTFEEFFIDSVTDNGAATAPAPAAATLAQIERGSTATNLRFQHVTLTIAAADTLKMYDFSPSEFADTSATSCPYQDGFGMIPTSVTGVADGAACAGSAAQPAGQTTPNAAEVLIGTDFYSGFTLSSDCRCAKTFTDMEPSATSTLVGAIGGILVFDVPFNGTTGYYYLDPKVAADAPITNTVAGM